MSDITRQYVAQCGVPAVAKKVFIRIQQMKDYLSSVVYTTSAVVPGEVAWPSEAEGAKILAKTWPRVPCIRRAATVRPRGQHRVAAGSAKPTG
jgi:hypothetical protein